MLEPSGEVLGLLPLTLSEPRVALQRARAVLAGAPSPLDASVARQAAGIVLRDFGDSREAVRELRVARRLARAAGSRPREADVCATLGIALVMSGRTAQGRAVLDEAVELAEGVAVGRILMRRGSGLLTLGEHDAALVDLDRAVRILHSAADELWEPRARTARAFTLLALGGVDRARTDLGRAEVLLDRGGQRLESARARQNRGVVAFRAGDLPAALDCLDDAGERFAALGIVDVDLRLDRTHVLLAAGLPAEAMIVADDTLAHLDGIGGTVARRAELLLAGAAAALAADDPQAARQRAAEAASIFSGQRRPWWRAHARLVELRARHGAGESTAPLLRSARRCAAALERCGSAESGTAHLLAGRVALELGRADVGRRHLSVAAQGRLRGPAASRAVGWLAVAMAADADGDARRLAHACGRGLRAVDELRGSMRSSELRAHVTVHGAELAAIAQRHALRRGSARQLLRWSERWRGSALVAPPVRPPADPAMGADLAALREITSRLDGPHPDGPGAAALRREQRRLEAAIRARAMRAAGTGPGDAGRIDVDALLAELGPDRMVVLVDVDGRLHALVCGAGRVRRFDVGPTATATREVEFARSGLRRVRRRPDAVLAQLGAAADGLARSLLGQARQHLGDGAVVVVPPGILHAVPWALLPELRTRAVDVAPSAAAWLRARRAPPAPSGRVVLIHGPGLPSAAGEVAELALGHPGATVLGGGDATAAAALAALDGADLAHVAAHGTFRADSPLFSSLSLDDGPLTVHDLEQLGRAPRLLLLPSCDSALLSPAGADELLGLTSSLLPLGTVGMVAGVVPVDDAATRPLMTALHRHLREGHRLAEALRRARAGAGDDPVAVATGWSFVSMGAG
ncbi:hypothetical protein PHY01_09990 [Pseudonocardia hydrocarbonoxydans]|uniref:CHAT domain-containing protein n=1 Tax=Pseudonocardia hydrocarbonoxydans TaxID=76726 RepID=A0A4Y3WN12_9PSEU|nr:CHAT domain-containing protein [Pseudonocardia hydrocarbonoxydans]GEC18716.1 hypothetical protein PHY01_09990 [Pseudonocardia hydrocarbonoxydans]